MLVTFLNRQLFWIVSVNLKNTNTEGKRDHTLNLPGKKSTYQTTETSSGSSESILALSVSAAVEQAGADGSACVLAGFRVLDSVWLDALLILISLYHTEEHDTETETVRDWQRSCNQTKCCVLYHRGKSPPDDAAVADRRLCRLLLRQGAAGPPLLPGAHSGLFAGVWALPPGHDRPRSRPPSLKANPGTGRLGGDIQPTGPLWILARVAAGAPPIQAVWGGDVAHLAVPLI